MFAKRLLFKQKDHAFYHVPSIVIAPDGSVLAFCEERWRSPCDDTGECHIVMKKSTDHGQTWGDLIHLRKKAEEKHHMGSAVTDPATGNVMLMCGGGWLKSGDNGETWQEWRPTVNIIEGTTGNSTHGSGPGIVLLHGKNKGRIVWPARTIVSKDGYNDSSIPDRQEKCFSSAMYSDDCGATIHCSNYFLQGTGEACLAERLNGELYFNTRAYFDDGRRYTAISHDGGSHFSEGVPDGQLREVQQGCNASMVRYPQDLCGGRDILLFANPDSSGKIREHGVVHVSFDGGKSWPLKKAVTRWGEWFDYSAMAVSHDGTILLMYKTTPDMTGMPISADGCCSMALIRFDLDWLEVPS
ncbi:sialidase family protein [uncultured Desulfosarcina sp.]|uniref:sialidase family protein n=1 Tax=uncultured Desulfosarcina sp. TaxID=218289 RepID=UPI0029C64CC1|nr:sialidase family protein [uncultured Desulfosarcina sp.]